MRVDTSVGSPLRDGMPHMDMFIDCCLFCAAGIDPTSRPERLLHVVLLRLHAVRDDQRQLDILRAADFQRCDLDGVQSWH